MLDQMNLARKPRVGDWWHDMYCPVLLVVGVTADTVSYTEQIETGINGGWRWPDQPTDVQTVNREGFVQLLTYKSSPELGLHARCVRKRQHRRHNP